MYWWARQYPVSDSKDEAEVDEHTAIDVYQWLREVCIYHTSLAGSSNHARRTRHNSAN